MSSSTISRSQAEMIEALRKQVRLLREYAQKVFVERNLDYVGEVANKLRLMVTKFRSNEPLLLRLMDETGIHPSLTLDGPPPPAVLTPSGLHAGDEITLEEFLKIDAIRVKVPSGGFVTLSKVNLIRALAEQAGGSHEDWDMDESLSTILSMQISIMGLPGAVFELKTSVDAVLSVAKRFLEKLENQGHETDLKA